MRSVLESLENSVSEKLKTEIKKRIVTCQPILSELSEQLKEYCHNNYDARYSLFKNDSDALHFSGDILAKTLHEFWTQGGDIENIFVENAQKVSFSSNINCIW